MIIVYGKTAGTHVDEHKDERSTSPSLNTVTMHFDIFLESERKAMQPVIGSGTKELFLIEIEVVCVHVNFVRIYPQQNHLLVDFNGTNAVN